MTAPLSGAIRAPDPSGWQSLGLDSTFHVIVREERPERTAATERAVERLWADARAARPGLFNGRIFSADRITSGHVTGHWTDYRHALAQMMEPTLFGDSPVRQLAVCGLLRCADGLVLGRRNPASLYLGGFWQSPPAGTVESRNGDDTVDLAGQLLAEAEEELGLLLTELEVGLPRLAVTHTRTLIVDIGLPLATSLDFQTLKARWKQTRNTEYERLELIPDRDLKSALLDRSDILPTTRHLLAGLSSSG